MDQTNRKQRKDDEKYRHWFHKGRMISRGSGKTVGMKGMGSANFKVENYPAKTDLVNQFLFVKQKDL